MSAADRDEREAAGRRPALRLRSQVPSLVVEDRLCGSYEGVVDDVVLRRADGVPAYNLAVVVDDATDGIGEVVRGDDLLSSTPRQVHLARLLDLPVPVHAHVPLVLAPDGTRLAKRHGAVTLADLGDPYEVRSRLLGSLGLDPADPVGSFDPDRLPRDPWVLSADDL